MSQQMITDIGNTYRLQKTGTTESYGADPVYEKVNYTVVPASADIMSVYPGIPGYQLYELFTPDNVAHKNGDKIIMQDGTEYIVKGVPVVIKNRYINNTRIVGQMKV